MNSLLCHAVRRFHRFAPQSKHQPIAYFLGTCGLLLTLVSPCWQPASAQSPVLTAQDGKIRVAFDDQLFCEVDYSNYEKPIVYPILGPGQVPMTRNFPMKENVAGEASDHPHHKSMWFGHGDVNRISFWHGEGKIVTDRAAIIASAKGESPRVQLKSRLVGPDGELIGHETQLMKFSASNDARWIDWEVTVHATQGDLTFGDTKEGTAALRLHPKLRLRNDPDRGVTKVTGKAINSAGDSDVEVWGKSARWVDYSGVVEGREVGVAFLDHPENYGHPTHWHARHYGLFAANPFGLSYFVGDEHDGSHTVKQGNELRLQYRIVFHAGKATADQVEAMYRAYTSGS